MKKTSIIAAFVAIFSISALASAALIKPWRENYQVASIKTIDQKSIEVYRFDDDNGVSCYVTSRYGNALGDGPIDCVKTK